MVYVQIQSDRKGTVRVMMVVWHDRECKTGKQEPSSKSQTTKAITQLASVGEGSFMNTIKDLSNFMTYTGQNRRGSSAGLVALQVAPSPPAFIPIFHSVPYTLWVVGRAGTALTIKMPFGSQYPSGITCAPATKRQRPSFIQCKPLFLKVGCYYG